MVLAHTIVLAPNHGASSRAAAISAPRLAMPTQNTTISSSGARLVTPETYRSGPRNAPQALPVWMVGTDLARDEEDAMAVTTFRDFPVADRDQDWDGSAAEKRVRTWAEAEDSPNEKYRDAHVWYDAEKKENFTAYKLLITDVVDGKLQVVPRGLMAAGNVMQAGRGGVDLPAQDVDRVKSHLAKYYGKLDETPPWED